MNFAVVAEAWRAVQFRGWVVVELDEGNSTLSGPDSGAGKNGNELRKIGSDV